MSESISLPSGSEKVWLTSAIKQNRCYVIEQFNLEYLDKKPQIDGINPVALDGIGTLLFKGECNFFTATDVAGYYPYLQEIGIRSLPLKSGKFILVDPQHLKISLNQFQSILKSDCLDDFFTMAIINDGETPENTKKLMEKDGSLEKFLTEEHEDSTISDNDVIPRIGSIDLSALRIKRVGVFFLKNDQTLFTKEELQTNQEGWKGHKLTPLQLKSGKFILIDKQQLEIPQDRLRRALMKDSLKDFYLTTGTKHITNDSFEGYLETAASMAIDPFAEKKSTFPELDINGTALFGYFRGIGPLFTKDNYTPMTVEDIKEYQCLGYEYDNRREEFGPHPLQLESGNFILVDPQYLEISLSVLKDILEKNDLGRFLKNTSSNNLGRLDNNLEQYLIDTMQNGDDLINIARESSSNPDLNPRSEDSGCPVTLTDAEATGFEKLKTTSFGAT